MDEKSKAAKVILSLFFSRRNLTFQTLHFQSNIDKWKQIMEELFSYQLLYYENIIKLRYTLGSGREIASCCGEVES